MISQPSEEELLSEDCFTFTSIFYHKLQIPEGNQPPDWYSHGFLVNIQLTVQPVRTKYRIILVLYLYWCPSWIHHTANDACGSVVSCLTKLCYMYDRVLNTGFIITCRRKKTYSQDF